MAPALLETSPSAEMSQSVITSAKFPPEAHTEAYAKSLDAQCPLRHLRDEYIIPTKASLKASTLPSTSPDQNTDPEEQAIYLCGNSLGLQPKRTASYISAQLTTWATLGVHGHFSQLAGSPLRAWQDLAAQAAEQSVAIVGAASATEVAIMNSLTANLHLAMAAFYKPVGRRRKILLESKAFPSDHYAIESQVRWHGYEPKETMLLLEPDRGHLISTEEVLRVIDESADEIALVLLPGIQYYTGQLFDIETITRHAKAKEITIGWDLAHAAGNVPLKLHDWDVDFAAWCTYKYMNGGPGSIAGLFVHEKYGKVELNGKGDPVYMPRLMGWYGGDKASRFQMDNNFVPIPGAGGFQLSNPSAIDLASLTASLAVFSDTNIQSLRNKSLKLTAYLQYLLLKDIDENSSERLFRIITPLNPNERGAQLSILLKPGYLKETSAALREAGIVADQREPGVIRVAPVPMYNTFWDVWRFVRDFKKALGI